MYADGLCATSTCAAAEAKYARTGFKPAADRGTASRTIVAFASKLLVFGLITSTDSDGRSRSEMSSHRGRFEFLDQFLDTHASVRHAPSPPLPPSPLPSPSPSPPSLPSPTPLPSPTSLPSPPLAQTLDGVLSVVARVPECAGGAFTDITFRVLPNPPRIPRPLTPSAGALVDTTFHILDISVLTLDVSDDNPMFAAITDAATKSKVRGFSRSRPRLRCPRRLLADAVALPSLHPPAELSTWTCAVPVVQARSTFIGMFVRGVITKARA